MDTAMRDLERIEERSSEEGRRVLLLSMVGLVAAVGIVGATVAALPAQSEPEGPDLLQALALEGASARDPKLPDAELDPRTLSFPTTLVTESRPEVAAAMAAAAAELEHLDPVTSPPRRSRIAAGLPASVTAGPDREIVEIAAVRDPLVAATVPKRTRTSPAGHIGLYTLQVISYSEPQEAQVFAEALRKRGHAAFVTSGKVEDRGTHWRVQIGPFASRQDAQSYRTAFEREEGMNTFIVRNKG